MAISNLANLLPAPSSLSPEKALKMAKIAESAERYAEMVEYMKRATSEVASGDNLTVEERNLISVGYKNLMSARRTAFRVIESKEASMDGADAGMTEYKEKVQAELKELIEQVESEVVGIYTEGAKKATDDEVLVFFYKMKGDYNRYGAEVTSHALKAEFTEKAQKAYLTAKELCEVKVPEGTWKAKEKNEALPEDNGKDYEDALPPTNPIRLGLALNFSVFMYEILDKKADASELATKAFEDAIDKLDELTEEQYRDSTLIMQLLKDNRDLWESEAQEDNE
jgi:hypothetical protein